MAWYNTLWLKRKPITLTGGSSGAQTDYQVKFTVVYDSNMQADFADLRFTKSDGTTLLNAWMEDYTASTSATIWVETDTPGDAIESDIYMYYDNSAVSSDWNINNTFLFGDDIDTGAVNYADGISDRGTAYSIANHIIRFGTKTHICYLKYESGHKAYVRTYDHTTDIWGSETLLGIVNDNHGIPSFVIDSSGYIYIFYDGHHATMKWRKSTNTNDTTAWSTEAALPNQAYHPCYPSVTIDSSDNVHLIYRRTDTTPLNIYYQKYSSGSWSSATILVSGDSTYHASYDNSIIVDSNDDLHVATAFFHIAENKGKKAGYMKSTDGGSTWEESDGTPYTIPVTYSSVESIVTGDNLRVGNIVVDASNRPMFSVTRYHNSPHDAQFWRFNGSSWVSTVLSVSSKALSDYMVTGAYNDVVYVFGGVYDTGEQWGHASGEVYLFYSSDDGANFSQKQISTTSSSHGNWFPSVERANGANSLSEMRVLWLRGVTALAPNGLYFAKLDDFYNTILYKLSSDAVPYYAWGSKWTEYTSDYISSPNSIKGYTTGTETGVSTINGVDLSELTNMPTSGVIELDFKNTGGWNTWLLLHCSLGKRIFAGNDYAGRGFYRGDWATWSGESDMTVLMDGDWHKFVVTYTPTTTQIQVDARTPVDLSTTTTVGYPKTLGLVDTSSGVSNNYLLDNIFVRDYVTDPVTYVFGSEEGEIEVLWYNTSWLKRRKITLTGGSSGAQTDYQVKLDITYDSDMQVDFDDLRFTKADGATLLDAWLESKVDSTSAIVWVETDTPADTVEADIYMYYGNSGAASVSNGENTFPEFFDDFTDGNYTEWNITSETGDTVSATSYELALVKGPNTGFLSAARNSTSQLSVKHNWDFIIEYDSGKRINLKLNGDNSNPTQGAIDLAFYSSGIRYYDTTYHNICAMSADTKYRCVVVPDVETDTFDIYVYLYSTGAEVSYSDPHTGLNFRNNSTYINQYLISEYSANVDGGAVDNTIVRKYAANPATYAFGSESEYEPSSWYNTSWSKRKRVLLTGDSSGAQTDYQVKFDVTYDSDMDANFADLRFTASDGTTLLDYWVEDYTASTSAVVWVETDTPADAVKFGIYMYYGNSGAESVSNGENTFLLFDDFPGAALDGGKWSSTTGSTVSGGELSVVVHSGNGSHTSSEWNRDVAFRGKVKRAEPGDGNMIGFVDGWGTDACVFRQYTDNRIQVFSGGSQTTVSGDTALTTYKTVDVTWLTDEVRYIVDGVEETNSPITTNVPTSSIPIGFHGVTSKTMYSEWVLVRNYVANPATYEFESESESGEPVPDPEPVDWYNASWSNRRKITLTGDLSGAQTDYQVKFDVTYDSDMQANFDDLRFTKTDGTTLLNAWLESKTDSTAAEIWVKTDTPANAVDADIYMYYGNSGASSYWDGPNTFLQFDDFNDGSITDWSGQTASFEASTDTSYEGTHSLKKTGSNSHSNAYIYKTETTSDIEIESRVWNSDALKERGGIFISKSADPDNYYALYFDPNGSLSIAEFNNGAFISNLSRTLTVASISSAQWCRYVLRKVGTTWDIYVYLANGDVVGSITGYSSPAFTPGYVGIHAYDQSQYADQFKVRKYAVNPATYVFGAESEYIASDWYNASWSNRRKITLTGGSSGAQTDYQIEVVVDHDSNMQSDFSDLRFTKSDGITLINAWLETYVELTSATVWIKCPTTPADTETEDYYMYYGNPEVSDYWDIDNTVLLGDDFEGESLDTDKWEGTNLPSVEGGKAHFDGYKDISSKTAYDFDQPVGVVYGLNMISMMPDDMNTIRVGIYDRNGIISRVQWDWYKEGWRDRYITGVYGQWWLGTNKGATYGGSRHLIHSTPPNTFRWKATGVKTFNDTRNDENNYRYCSTRYLTILSTHSAVNFDILWVIIVKMVENPATYTISSEEKRWYNVSWRRRQPITLTGGSSGAQTDYQVKLNVTFDPDMQSDFSDLRFTESDGITPLSAWLESYTESTSAVIWVKTDTPADTVESDIYMYYSNSEAVSTWNGPDTFIQWHGFADCSLEGHFTDPPIVHPTNVAYGGRGRVTDNHIVVWGLFVDVDHYSYITSQRGSDFVGLYTEGGGSGQISVTEQPRLTNSVWHDLIITNDGTNLCGYVDGDMISEGCITNGLPDVNVGLHMGLFSSPGTGEQDWSYAREYVVNSETHVHGDDEPWCNWYDKSWLIRRAIILTGGVAGAQTDYQVKLEIPYSSNMQVDFDDLRFTKSDGITLLDAWLETKVDSTSAVIWVKTDTPAEDIEATIYMYYYNTEALSIWDGPNTFIQFTGEEISSYLASSTVHPTDVAYGGHFRVQDFHSFDCGLRTNDGDTEYTNVVSHVGMNTVGLYCRSNSNESSVTEMPPISIDVWHDIIITNDSVNVCGYVDGDLVADSCINTNLPTFDLGLNFDVHCGPDIIEHAWAYAREYVVGSSTYTIEDETNWYDEVWGSRRSIILTGGASGAQTDYQIKLDVVYDPDMKYNFSDLRFMESDGVTPISSWLETKVDSTSAVIWIKVDTPAEGIEKTIYMYYENPAAAAVWSGEDTFIQFRGVSEIYTESPTVHPTNVAYGGRFRTGAGHVFECGLRNNDSGTEYMQITSHHGLSFSGLYCRINSDTASVNESTALPNGVWNDVMITNDSVNVCGYVNGDLIADSCIDTHLPVLDLGIHLMKFCPTYLVEQAWAYAREYVVNPATYIFEDDGPDWYHPNWGTRKKITLTGNESGAQINYQIKLTIPYNSNMQVDFDDLRFTESDGVTLIDSWLEIHTVGEVASVWVEFPTTPADTMTEDYYIYYNNPTAISAWDGPNTFIQWHGEANAAFQDLAIVHPTNVAYGGRLKALEDHILECGLRTSGVSGAEFTNILSHFELDIIGLYCRESGNQSSVTESPSMPIGIWHDFMVTNDSTNVCGYFNGDLIANECIDTNLPIINLGLSLTLWCPINLVEQAWSYAREYVINPATYIIEFDEENMIPIFMIYYKRLRGN